ncbi:hypothetical protein N7U66_12740 [Lacinutrix neustonica]|uniref:Uncharacterized protein n=1 Tax=Lacinutrix neustonica TaxID=2980107 RepID=A0A9E8MT79_9FLAO|nr:hypothetical protein [Lacinutrix neustonica]WAC01042.1 hypothetical protein N7U66_12740 [Lacinutrix neustonica]
MKTQNQNVLFNHNSIVELNDRDISKIHGGSSEVIEIITRAATYGTWFDFGL